MLVFTKIYMFTMAFSALFSIFRNTYYFTVRAVFRYDATNDARKEYYRWI